jgi:hypothetical protein
VAPPVDPEPAGPEPVASGDSDPLSTDPLRPDADWRAGFADRAGPILERHRSQTADQVAALRRRYAGPVFGKVRVWELIERLGSCIDPTDERLFCASQQVHVLQMLEAMEADGFDSPEMVLVALIHDLGKVLLLTGEDPANIVCMNTPIGAQEEGIGLSRALIQWNHDEFAYDRLVGLIPDDLAWLIRFHSIDIPALESLMDDRDRERTSRLLVPFAHYDHATKTPLHLPTTSLATYRELIEEAFPDPIPF